jgi:hypothetical protein
MSEETPTRFIFPEKVNDTIRGGKNPGKPKTKSTVNLYRALMHQITRATGITTIQELMKRHIKTNRAIKVLAAKKDDESEAAHKSRVRNFYSALFYVLPEEYISKPNPYYRAFQAWKDNKPEETESPE